MDGKWLSVLEYAAFKKKSISTVRRYIKANRVKFKEESGKYFIWTKNFGESKSSDEKESLELKFENERLKKENIFLKEQISEMEMLVNIYESKKRESLPTLPQELM
jgi:hypothetical protein